MGAAVNTFRTVDGASVGIKTGRRRGEKPGRPLRRPYGLGTILVMLALVFPLAAALPPSAVTPMPQAVPDSLRADSVAARRGVSRADTTLIIKHHFNHRQQIITGSAIMAGLAMVMVVMNNYNPRGFEQ